MLRTVIVAASQMPLAWPMTSRGKATASASGLVVGGRPRRSRRGWPARWRRWRWPGVNGVGGRPSISSVPNITTPLPSGAQIMPPITAAIPLPELDTVRAAAGSSVTATSSYVLRRGAFDGRF